jgi:hypothetical protein
MLGRTKDHSYSYEIYGPEATPGNIGPRIDLEDGFERRSAATRAMRAALMNEPAGSFGTVYKRESDGKMTFQRNYIKKEFNVKAF